MKKLIPYILVGVLASYLFSALNHSGESAVSEPAPSAVQSNLSPDEKLNIKVFQEASPSVVFITSIAYARSFFSLNVFEIPQGTGSGFVWNKDGYIITNYHVIKDANAAEVTLSDGSKWKAKLVGTEPDKDLAVLKISAPAKILKPIRIGTSSNLKVGQRVFAIGNPFGLDHTLTTGVISGLGREIVADSGRKIRGAIQTDAAINPGNSGGPLLDSSGRLIGINTAILSPSGAYAGIGFAVPIDTIKRLANQIIKYGYVKKAGLGIKIADDYIAERLGLKGVLIVDVVPGGPASRAGLRGTIQDRYGNIKLGDIIIKADNIPISNSEDLFAVLERHNIGDRISITVLRDNKTLSFIITLAEI